MFSHHSLKPIPYESVDLDKITKGSPSMRMSPGGENLYLNILYTSQYSQNEKDQKPLMFLIRDAYVWLSSNDNYIINLKDNDDLVDLLNKLENKMSSIDREERREFFEGRNDSSHYVYSRPRPLVFGNYTTICKLSRERARWSNLPINFTADLVVSIRTTQYEGNGPYILVFLEDLTIKTD